MWWLPLLTAAVAAYAVYKLFVFATADGDLTVLSRKLNAGYFSGKVVWVTGASSGSKSATRVPREHNYHLCFQDPHAFINTTQTLIALHLKDNTWFIVYRGFEADRVTVTGSCGTLALKICGQLCKYTNKASGSFISTSTTIFANCLVLDRSCQYTS